MFIGRSDKGERAMLYFDQVKSAIVHLNNVYGKGSVSNVRVFMDGRVTFDQTPYGCSPSVRRGRVNGNTVFALGHQRTFA